jgi:multidrug resistance efflux pump
MAQHFVPSPADGVLAQLLVEEGDTVPRFAPLILLASPDHERRVRAARTEVADARMALKETQMSAMGGNRSAPTSASSLALQEHAEKKRDEAEIRARAGRVRELTIAVTSLQARRVDLKTKPFAGDDYSAETRVLDAELVRLQSTLDMATAELDRQRRTTSTRLSQTSVAARNPQNTRANSRAIQSARETLARRQAELDAALGDEFQFTIAIQAPFSGQIIRFLHNKGTYVREGEPLVILIPRSDTDKPQP